MNLQQFKNPTIYFVILSFLLASCSSVTLISPTNTITPSVTPLPTNTFTPTTTPTPNSIRDFAFSPDGSKIAVYEEDGIFIYDTISSEKTLFSRQTCVNCGCEGAGAVAFSPDGTKLASSSSYVTNLIEIKDITVEKPTWTIYDVPNENCAKEIEFSPDGNTLLVLSSHSTTMRCEFPEYTLELYSLDRQSTFFYESRMFQMWWCAESKPVVKFLSNSTFYLFFFGETISRLRIGDTHTGQIIETHEYDIAKDGWFYDISQDGQALAVSPSITMFENPTTSIVDPISRKSLMTVPYYVILLGEKDQFIVYDLNNAWKFWKNGSVVCSYDFTTYPKLKFSADYNFMAAHTVGNQIEIWRVSTCEKINTISVSE